ncbi:MAG: CotH kinase family protein [Planctomycetes bacterium]|nr:CotH kinase family protein [Planctomycetota bacterium]
MVISRRAGWILLAATALLVPRSSAQDFVIAELMASNTGTLEDEDGDYSDWVEVLNAGPSSASLQGWYLTDLPSNLTRWRFPAVTLSPGASIVVFASGKDRTDPAGRLHTNFQIEALGGYLALVRPDGTTRATELAPYPPQVDDYSFGLEQNGRMAAAVVAGAASWALIPANGNLGLTWTQVGFDDASWIAGTTGVGYDRNPDYGPLIGTNVRAQMENISTTAYVRVPFDLAGAASYTGLTLRMKYDDGYGAYLNGTLIASRNAPGTLAWSSAAMGDRPDPSAVVFEEVDVSSFAGLLREGQNVLAVHGLNNGAGSSDFLVVPELDAIATGSLDRSKQLYFPQPTPGRPNLQGYPGVAETPLISEPSRVFTGTLSVTVSAGSPTGIIRYTLDGSEPAESSPELAAPLAIGQSTRLRARVFEPGLAPGPVASEGYIALDAALGTFSSDIPVFVVDNFAAGSVPSDPYQAAFMALYEPGAGGRTSFSSPPELATRIGIKLRGSSTQGDPKHSYRLETWDERSVDKDVSPLGLPEDSDWILYAPYGFDLALLRNPFMYELSNQVGRYAVRTRLCELYFNTGGGRLNAADYQGVYVFMESIKRGEDRVDVERLDASDRLPPDVTGGYMWKIDRLDPGDSGFSAGGTRMGWAYPKERNVAPAQAAYLTGFINEFVAVLNGAGFADPVNGYAKYIDQDSWIDHHILNVLAKNVDALRLSTYMFKSRGGKFEYGPIWDFDRSINSTDGRDDDPRTWNGTGDATRFFEYPWWVRLFQDPELYQRYRDRWAELRRGPLSTSSVNATIDGMASQLGEAHVRNFQKWPLINPSQWQGQVNLMKSWLSTRSTWIDGQFLLPPAFSSRGRQISPGFQLTVTASSGTIHYTLDGADPRQRGGAVAPGALTYGGPITLDANARVAARTRLATGDWTPLTAETFWVEVPRLVIAEMHFHPADPLPPDARDADDFEFLELVNAGPAPLDMEGASLSLGIEHTFSPGAPLAPGERVVIVKDLAAFTARYGAAGIRIAGEYSGRLGNGGDAIRLLGPLREPILELQYSDDWYPEADGTGPSLVIKDTTANLALWDVAGSWTPSSVSGGTPGEPDPAIDGTGGLQRPGDSNQDGVVDLSDAVSLLFRLFAGAGTLPCDGSSLGAGGNLVLLDSNGDAQVNLADAVHVLNYLFKDGPQPSRGATCVRIEGCPTECRF